MHVWLDYGTEWDSPDVATPDLEVTDNPVVATLLGPNGATLRQWRERPLFGFQRSAGG